MNLTVTTKIDILTFTSPSTARNLFKMAEGCDSTYNLINCPIGKIVGAIDPPTKSLKRAVD